MEGWWDGGMVISWDGGVVGWWDGGFISCRLHLRHSNHNQR